MSKLILIWGLRLSYHSFGFEKTLSGSSFEQSAARVMQIAGAALHQNARGGREIITAFSFECENINSWASRQWRGTQFFLLGGRGRWSSGGLQCVGHLCFHWHFTMQDRCKIARWQLGVTEAEQKESPIAAFGNTVAKKPHTHTHKKTKHWRASHHSANSCRHTQIRTQTPPRIQAMEQSAVLNALWKKRERKETLCF